MKLAYSLSFRLALTYAALFLASIGTLAGMYYWLAIHRPLGSVRSQIMAESNRLGDLYQRGGAAALIPELEQRAGAPSSTLAYHALLEPDGRAIVTNLPSWPRKRSADWLRIDADISREGEEDEYEALVFDHLLPDGRRLLVGRDIEDLEQLEEMLTDSAVWLLPTLLLLVTVGGSIMSRAIGRRIEAVDAAARRVMAGDFSERVPVHGTGDDFDRFSETLNLMLTRIERSFDAVRRVSDSVAHELRTPLARLQAELADLDAHAVTADREGVQRAVREAERLGRLFDGVLRISRIEAGRHSITTRPVELSKIALECAEFYQPAADEKKLEFMVEIAAGLSVRADPDLLFQAIGNIIDNAIKFTSVGGRVTLNGGQDSYNCWVAVADTGPGIAPDVLDRVTERFFRAPLAASTPGFGLGLSFVSAVAAAHGAKLMLSDSNPGLIVRLVFEVPNRSTRPKSDVSESPAR